MQGVEGFFWLISAALFCMLVYEVLRMLSALWPLILQAWNENRPRPNWRLRPHSPERKQTDTVTPSRSSQATSKLTTPPATPPQPANSPSSPQSHKAVRQSSASPPWWSKNHGTTPHKGSGSSPDQDR